MQNYVKHMIRLYIKTSIPLWVIKMPICSTSWKDIF